MANQIIIDIGATANDGTGNPLRTAFNDVNLNFSSIWATGVANSNIAFDGNRILTTNTNGNLILAPNGVGVVQSNVSIVPNQTRIRNLGSPSNKWLNVYTQYLDVASLTVNNDLTVSGNLTVMGNVINMGNIVTDTLTIQLANTTSTANAANGAGITVGANDDIATLLYNSTGNVWTTNIGLSATGNITGSNVLTSGIVSASGNVRGANINTDGIVSAVGNITGNYFIGNGSQLTGIVTSSYANANVVAYGEAGWAGNIIPSGNSVYSLGNATNQWSDLYVSNATIYMNNVPIGLTAGNVLTVNGEAVLTNDSDATITTTGNITAGYLFGDGSQLTGISALGNSITNGTSNVEIATAGGPVTVNAGGAYTWTFDDTGNLTVPGAIDMSTADINNVGAVYAGGNVEANYFIGDGSQLTGIAPANEIIYSFTYGQATPWLIGTIPANKVVTGIELVITVPFDDVASSVTVGTNTAPAQLLSASDVLTSTAGTYSVQPGHKYTTTTDIYISITPGTSTAGEGVLVLNYQ